MNLISASSSGHSQQSMCPCDTSVNGPPASHPVSELPEDTGPCKSDSESTDYDGILSALADQREWPTLQRDASAEWAEDLAPAVSAIPAVLAGSMAPSLLADSGVPAVSAGSVVPAVPTVSEVLAPLLTCNCRRGCRHWFKGACLAGATCRWCHHPKHLQHPLPTRRGGKSVDGQERKLIKQLEALIPQVQLLADAATGLLA